MPDGYGFSSPWDVLPTSGTFRRLRKAATQSLQGVSITADRYSFSLNGKNIDATASSIDSLTGCDAALVGSDRRDLWIYKFDDLKPVTCGIWGLRPTPDRRSRIYLSTFNRPGDIHVLHMTESSIPTENSDRSYEIKVVTLRESYLGDRFTRHIHQTTSLWSEAGDIGTYVPICMAADQGANLAIAFGSGKSVDYVDQVSVRRWNLDNKNSNQLGVRPYPAFKRAKMKLPLPSLKYSIRKIAFASSGFTLRCYSNTDIIPPFHVPNSDNPVHEGTVMNSIYVRCGEERLTFSPDEPFFTCHKSVYIPPTPESSPTLDPLCQLETLFIGTTEMCCGGPRTKSLAYVFKTHSLMPSVRCNHHRVAALSPRAISNYNFEVVARLWGFNIPPSNMPPALAYSRKGTRIAIVCWDKIFVWPLRPQILAQSDISAAWSAYPKTWDKLVRSNVVELKPIVLEAEDVVHKMAFMSCENRLLALTGKGVQIWDMGPMSIGRRESRPLPQDCLSKHEWPDAVREKWPVSPFS